MFRKYSKIASFAVSTSGLLSQGMGSGDCLVVKEGRIIFLKSNIFTPWEKGVVDYR